MADMRKLERESKTITNSFNSPGDPALDKQKYTSLTITACPSPLSPYYAPY